MTLSTFGGGGFGAGPYSVTPQTRPPTHILGIGPRAAGINWRGAANYGRAPSIIGPGGPELRLPNPTSMSFTLRRDGGCEASVDFDQPRGSAYIIQELVTDLWWRRHDPKLGVTDNIGRFNADNVDMSGAGDRLRTTATLVDYRTLLEARIVTAASVTYPAGTAVATILAAAIPANIDINISALTTTNLGVTSTAVTVEQGTTVGQVIESLRNAAATFEYAVEMADTNAGLPVLRLWPNGRGSTRNVVLIDDGSGASPIESWRRTVDGADYATTVYYRGNGFASIAVLDATTLPTGPRDSVESGDAGSQFLADIAAQRLLLQRSALHQSWSLTLRRGFWQGRTHIDVGDVIGVYVRMGAEVITSSVRVEEIGVEVDAAGSETVTLTTGTARLSVHPRSRNAPLARIVRRFKIATS